MRSEVKRMGMEIGTRALGRRGGLLIATIGLLAGCGDDGSAAASGSEMSTSTSAGSTADSVETSAKPPVDVASSGGELPPSGTDSGTTAVSTTEEPSDTMPPIIFDQGEIPESPRLDESCGKVDFMFVIDNSGSMYDEQANLIANFPTFIDGIQASLDSVDEYHVGVITTDAYTYNVPECQALSGLVVQTGGLDSSNMMCGPFEEGNNFMTQEDDLAAAFTCTAQVGTYGSGVERPMQAMYEAVTGLVGGPTECNHDYMREDALLVIVIITDEPDTASVGDPTFWYDTVVEAKGGFPENVVVLSLINTPGGTCGFDIAPQIANFTMMFGENGFMADICIPDYEPVFTDAVSIIDNACDNFMPPG